MAGGDDEDDDFQNPSQAALSQSIMLSSLKSRLSQPLKPSNGYRAQKRQKLSAAYGKENDSILKNRPSISRVLRGGKEKTPVSTERTKLDHKTFPAGLGNIDIAVGCLEEDGIEDLISNLSASDVPRILDGCPCEEGRFGKGSPCLASFESSPLKSAESASSNFDLDCSNVCTSNDALTANIMSSCDSDNSVAVCETEPAHEYKVCNEAEVRGACLASTELGLAGDWPRKKMEIQILNHFVDHGSIENKREISSEARFLETKKKSVLSECRDYSSRIDGFEELKLNKQFTDPKVHEKGSIGGNSCQSGIVLLDKIRGNHNTMSIEAKLLDPSRKLAPYAFSSSGEEVGICDEFELGTQLNMLTDLCYQMGEQGYSGGRMSSIEQFNLSTESIALERTLLVQCPLCQSDLTKLSEEMRQIHTNDCLDKDDINEVKYSFT